MARGLHESGVALVGDFGLVHVEGINVNLADRSVVLEWIPVPGEAGVGPVVAAPAGERAARDEDHPGLGGETDLAAEDAEKREERPSHSDGSSYRPVIHGRDARATMASWPGRPGHATKLDRFVNFVSTKRL